MTRSIYKRAAKNPRASQSMIDKLGPMDVSAGQNWKGVGAEQVRKLNQTARKR